eukprot:8036251-Lingulodinium_polyedra.AAC.1
MRAALHPRGGVRSAACSRRACRAPPSRAPLGTRRAPPSGRASAAGPAPRVPAASALWRCSHAPWPWALARARAPP